MLLTNIRSFIFLQFFYFSITEWALLAIEHMSLNAHLASLMKAWYKYSILLLEATDLAKVFILEFLLVNSLAT